MKAKEKNTQALNDLVGEELVSYVLRDLLNAVIPTDIATVDKVGRLYINGEPITAESLKTLQSEVKFLKETNLYRILFGTPRDLAMKAMFEKAQSWDDMRAGKMLLYALDVQQKLLSTILRGKAE